MITRSFWCIHTWSFTFSSKSASCASSSIKFSSTIGTMMSAIFRLTGGFSHNFWENTLNDDEIWVSWISWMELEATKGSERQWTDRLMCIFVYIYTKSHDIYLNSHIKFVFFNEMPCTNSKERLRFHWLISIEAKPNKDENQRKKIKTQQINSISVLVFVIYFGSFYTSSL